MKISLWFSVLLMLLRVSFTHAGSATWEFHPRNNSWNQTFNWTPETVPDGPADVATFDASSKRIISQDTFNAIELSEIVFTPSASAFTIQTATNAPFTISGTGITNNSGIVQNFVVLTRPSDSGYEILSFTNSATAGNLTQFTTTAASSSSFHSGRLEFYNTARAGSATINNADD
jgi:hypothetical protein